MVPTNSKISNIIHLWFIIISPLLSAGLLLLSQTRFGSGLGSGSQFFGRFEIILVELFFCSR
jgi:hypothetical protein